MKKSTLFMTVALLCACAPQMPGPSYYTLSENSGGVAISSKKLSVDVGRIKIPEYADRSQIVTTNGVNVTMSPDAHWAERMSPMVQRRLMSGLRARLPGALVKSGDFMGAPADYSVFIEVYRIDGAMSSPVVLDATYSIVSGGTPVRTRRVKYDDAAGDTYSDYVNTIGDLIDRLSRDIARDLDKLAK